MLGFVGDGVFDGGGVGELSGFVEFGRFGSVESLRVASGPNDMGFGAVRKREVVDAVNAISGGVEAIVGSAAINGGRKVDMCAEVAEFGDHVDCGLRVLPYDIFECFGGNFSRPKQILFAVATLAPMIRK